MKKISTVLTAVVIAVLPVFAQTSDAPQVFFVHKKGASQSQIR